MQAVCSIEGVSVAVAQNEVGNQAPGESDDQQGDQAAALVPQVGVAQHVDSVGGDADPADEDDGN